MTTNDLFDPTDPDYEHFGVCPICGKTDGYLNYGSSHYFVCDAHQVYWEVGANLFSCWKDEDEATWEANAEKLSAFTEVEPVHNKRLCKDEIAKGNARPAGTGPSANVIDLFSAKDSTEARNHG